MRFSSLLLIVVSLFSCLPQSERSNEYKEKIEDSLFGYMKYKAEQFLMPIESMAADSILNIKTIHETNMPFDNSYYALAFNWKAKSNISREDDAMMKEFLIYLKQLSYITWMSRKPKWTRENLRVP